MVTYDYTGSSTTIDPTSIAVGCVIAIIVIIATWKIFEKAGEPGWGALVPFYNTYLLFKIAFGNGWLFLLLIIPIVNFVVLIILYAKLAKAFGKGIGYTLGLIFLSPIFMMMLGFGSAQYQGAK